MAVKVTLRGDVARARLQALELTQYSLAATCEIDLRTVQRWFAGRPVRLVDAERVAEVLRIGTGDLFVGVPEEGSSTTVAALFSLISRLPGLRDHPSTPILRMAPKRFAPFFEPLHFRPHPMHGFVCTVSLHAVHSHGFLVLRISTSAPRLDIRALVRLTRSMLVLRAELTVRGDRVTLLETHFARSIRATRRADDGSFDLWFWVGGEFPELILASSDEHLAVAPLTQQTPSPIYFDMSAADTAHALCVRPTVSQLSAAGLPRGFDRIVHRDTSRVDFEP